MEQNKPTDCGVIVGRFQVPYLHEGHKELIDAILARHKKVAIFLGITPTKNTTRNPLDFATRKAMIQSAYPGVIILPINDVGNDRAWSEILDHKIREVFHTETVTLYGSRDGFIPAYVGKFPKAELQETKKISGSEIRSWIKDDVRNSEDFRRGVIYASFNKYPITYTTVDAAIMDDHGNVLLARKKHDEAGKYRFIGGFVNKNQDDSLEEAVKREVMEETNSLAVSEPVYIGSAKIDDWRYKNEEDGIMTTFFAMQYMFGRPEASDDIDEVKWFNIEKLVETEGYQLVKEHRVLLNLLKAHLEKRAQKKGE
jgi:bifunctional NMN adenylyltransferase/nudix hydrolase